MKFRVSAAAAIIAALLLTIVGCGGTLPPVQVVIDPSTVIPKPEPKPDPAPAVVARATKAFEVLDSCSLAPVEGVQVSLPVHGVPLQKTNVDGYVAFELPSGDTAFYGVSFTAAGYDTERRQFSLHENNQETVYIRPSGGCQPSPQIGTLQDLRIHVISIAPGGPASSSRAVPIPNAWCTINGDKRIADGAGFLHFPIPGKVAAECGAADFTTRTVALEPGDRGVQLFRSVPAATPPIAAPSGHCGAANFDGLTCVREVAAKYPHLLVINTFESCLEFTQRVLEALGPDWGHVGKSQGEGQSVPRGFTPFDYRAEDGITYRITGVSHDAIKHRVSGQVIDLLGNATANMPCDPSKLEPGEECWKPGPASVQWTDVPKFKADGTLQWRVSNPFVPAVPVRP